MNLLPEIEMPGHAGRGPGRVSGAELLPGRRAPGLDRWGINPDIFNPTDRTIAFLQDVLDEVLELFPSKFIHVGGDEAPKDYWKKSPRCNSA